MKIIIKGLKGFDIYEQTEDYLLEKFEKYEKMVKEPTVLEFTFEHSHKSKQTLDKVVHLTVTMPRMKNPEHLEEISTSFTAAIDLIQDRFDDFLRDNKERRVEQARRPRKQYIAKQLEKQAGEL